MSDNNESVKEDGILKNTIKLVINIFAGLFNFIFNTLFNSDFMKFLFNLFGSFVGYIKIVINEIFDKHFNDKSYSEIINSLFNSDEYNKMYIQSKQELNQNLIPKTSVLTFPLPELEDEPDSVSNPIYITFFLKIILMLIFCIVSFIILSIIFKIIIASYKMMEYNKM